MLVQKRVGLLNGASPLLESALQSPLDLGSPTYIKQRQGAQCWRSVQGEAPPVPNNGN